MHLAIWEKTYSQHLYHELGSVAMAHGRYGCEAMAHGCYGCEAHCEQKLGLKQFQLMETSTCKLYHCFAPFNLLSGRDIEIQEYDTYRDCSFFASGHFFTVNNFHPSCELM